LESEASLLHLQVPVTCPYSEPHQTSPCPTSHFLKIHLHIILPSMPGSSKWSLSLRFPHQMLWHFLKISMSSLDINNEVSCMNTVVLLLAHIHEHMFWPLWELWTILNLSKFMLNMQLIFILFNYRQGYKSNICSYIPINMLPAFAALESCHYFHVFCLGA
jgi:hypothetical protein